jgi:hypothetical protein
VRVGNEKDYPTAPFTMTSVPICTHTMAGKGEVVRTEPILHCSQGECGMSQEMVTRTPGGKRRDISRVRSE